ncbi:kinase-like domain-containing protein [Mycena capillaripes]|nr:kinase-like domain-containing protein [Mycena capillaripes]
MPPDSPPGVEEATADLRTRLPDLYKKEQTILAGGLANFEHFWRDHYSWLQKSNYLLRPRYSPDWSAPWKDGKKHPNNFSDSVLPPSGALMDATRISDGAYVVLKQTDRLGPEVVSGGMREAYIGQKVASKPLASDPKNHCIRFIEILHVPDNEDMDLIVMPLMFHWNAFPFLTIGEAVEFLSQIFEGLQFLHNNHIWHGDCKANNIVMDPTPILRDPPHPWCIEKTRDFQDARPPRSRTGHPVKYYWIDFDISDEHDPSKGPPLVDPGYGGIRHVPEFLLKDQKCDPFAVDVWCLGFLVQAYFTEGSELIGTPKKRGFGFLDELVAEMVQEDPAKRPNMNQVVDQFSKIKAGQSEWKLRSRFMDDQARDSSALRSIGFWARQLYFKARRIPAIPSPAS